MAVTSTRASVLIVLAAQPGSLSTRQVRDRINRDRSVPLVIERVYEALVALHHRGVVTRSGKGRGVHWRLAAGSFGV